MHVRRRPVLQGVGALIATMALSRPGPVTAQEASGLRYGPAEPFSFEGLIERARQLAAAPYVSPPRPAPEIVQQIDYDVHGKLRFRPEYALYGNGPGAFPVTFQFLGGFFPKTERMHAVEGGTSREILYSPEYFTVGEDSIARGLPADASAFAGFWVQESRLAGDWRNAEPWATFLGGAYFRAVGELG